MPKFLLFVFAVFGLFDDSADLKKKEPKVDPAQSLKTIISEADKRYKVSIREFRAAKTSADRDDLIDKNKADFIEWAMNKQSLPVEFECVVVNVVKLESGVYSAIVSVPRELLPFNAAMKKPLIARTQLGFDLSEDDRASITTGDKVKVSGKLSPELVIPEERGQRKTAATLVMSDKDSLLWLQCDRGTLGDGQPEKEFRSPYLKMTLVDVSFEVVEKK